MCDKGSVAKEKLGAHVSYGHCLSVICKHFDVAPSWPCFNSLYTQLSHGILLDKGTKKYKLDKTTNSNWWFAFARGILITWSEDPRYWKWTTIKESCESFEVAELIRVSWFNLHYKFSAVLLSSRVVYEVVWIIKLSDTASGWENPVNIELKRPNGCKIVRQQSFQHLKRGEWIEISAGDLLADNCGCEGGGEVETSMYEHGGNWKTGLILKGIEIRPRGPKCGA